MLHLQIVAQDYYKTAHNILFKSIQLAVNFVIQSVHQWRRSLCETMATGVTLIDPVSDKSIVKLFAPYDVLAGYPSHSIRRTFTTNTVNEVSTVGGSLRDMQDLAMYSTLTAAQRYINGDSEVRHKIVELRGSMSKRTGNNRKVLKFERFETPY